MILIVFSSVIFFYITSSLFLFSPYSTWMKWTFAALILLVSLKYVIYEYAGGAFFAPELPRSFLLLMEVLYGTLFILFFMLLLKDIFMLFLLVGKYFGKSWTLPFSLTSLKLGCTVLAFALGSWGTWQSVRVPDVRTVELRLAKLPPTLDGFSIVQLTDTHIGPILKKEWLQEVVDKTNNLSPDLIVLTGDYIDGTVKTLAEEVAPFAGLRAKYGVYGVTGNHEYIGGRRIGLPCLKSCM